MIHMQTASHRVVAWAIVELSVAICLVHPFNNACNKLNTRTLSTVATRRPERNVTMPTAEYKAHVKDAAGREEHFNVDVEISEQEQELIANMESDRAKFAVVTERIVNAGYENSSSCWPLDLLLWQDPKDFHAVVPLRF